MEAELILQLDGLLSSGFGLQQVCSATTFLVINNMNKMGVFAASYVIFKDKFTPLMVGGIAVTVAGGYW